MRFILLILLSVPFHIFAANVLTIPYSSQEKSELSLWSELARHSIKERLYLCEECFGHLVTFNIALNEHGEIITIELLESSGEPELEYYGKVAIEQAQPFRVDFLSERTLEKVLNVNMTIVPEE